MTHRNVQEWYPHVVSSLLDNVRWGLRQELCELSGPNLSSADIASRSRYYSERRGKQELCGFEHD